MQIKCKMYSGQYMLFDKEDKRAGKYYRSKYRCLENTNGTQSSKYDILEHSLKSLNE